MHEMSLAVALIDEVEQLANQEQASRVISVLVTIGELSGVEEEAFRLCFPLAAEGTLLENARLDIKHLPAIILCQDCREKTNPEVPLMQCGACQSTNVKVVDGRDFVISSVELE